MTFSFRALLFLFFTQGLFPQSLPFGPLPTQLGRDRSAEDDWMPLFFARDAQDHLVVPDFFKGRLVEFDAQGKYLRQIVPQKGVIPSLNAFFLNADGDYVINSSFHLWILDAKGKLKADKAFPLGFFPEGFFLSDQGLSLIQKAGKGTVTLFYPWKDLKTQSTPEAWVDRDVPRATVKAFGKEFTYRLGDMSGFEGWKLDEISDAGSFTLIQVNKRGQSFWAARVDSGWKTLDFDASGKLLKQSFEPLGEGEKPGFTILCDDAGHWAANGITKDAMIIHRWE